MLDIKDLRVGFSGVRVLNGASFAVRGNTITGLIGPNGAGKTTLFNCVTGLLPAMQGTIVFDGAPIAGLAPERITQAGLVRTFQLARGFPRMSVFEHLMLYGTGQPGERLGPAYFNSRAAARREAELQERAWQVARRVKLDHVIDNLATDISGGQKKLLEIGRALMADPKMILLDEPMAGVNPTLSRDIAEQLILLRDEGMTILLIEHDLELVRMICDEVVVMAEGTFLTRGSYDEVVADTRVQEAYLGHRHAVAQ